MSVKIYFTAWRKSRILETITLVFLGFVIKFANLNNLINGIGMILGGIVGLGWGNKLDVNSWTIVIRIVLFFILLTILWSFTFLI